MEHLVLLVVISDLHPGSQAACTLIWREQSVDHLQDRGLPRAVPPDQRHPLSPFDLEGQVFKELVGTKRFCQLLYG